ncbi:NAD-dependent epimerase [Ferrimonas balearica]|uniref:NAD-dependent epimerase n=1 Tax=Ferrimonas balearica TaxID=44012 RepID=UPI001C99FE68|nr:NAD-dependent epimerase [Ferrimonas balearica]MBY5923350.1 NAD-dependent epimerase [Ferrimonas balearica]MBY5995308.1 NAD-dependent epimerase [Ferrimonas balearica]
MKILVTGAAGFIGFYVSQRLLEQGHQVVGLDNLNDYYDVSLKEARLDQLTSSEHFEFVRLDLSDREGMAALFQRHQFDRVVHLAAQAGVRYSLDNPMAYVDSNLTGMVTILEGCRQTKVPHLIYASSSSVYGMNKKVPFAEADAVDHPVSLYAATKKSNELMAHTYSHLYGIPTTGLRFFTVYGPWGRPDMAAFKFTKKILAGEPIDVYNYGKLSRDFTYIDDIVEGVLRVMENIPTADAERTTDRPDRSTAPYALYNIGNHQPVELLTFIQTLEQALGVKAELNLMPMQPGDVYTTYADTDNLRQAVGFSPDTSLAEGLQRFADWYRSFYRI